MKTCKQCLIPKDTSEFWVRKDSLDGMNARCRACCNHRQRGYKNKRPQLYARLNKNNRVKYRKEVLDAYGHACACCGETRWQFLAIDHVNGGGCKHRDKVGTMGVYLDARKRGFPKRLSSLVPQL